MKRSHENPSVESTPPDNASTTTGAQSSSPSEGGFLGRWSKRKRDSVTTTLPEPQIADSLPADVPGSSTVLDKTAQPDSVEPAEITEHPMTDADMPDIDTLNSDSDFSPFFSEGVSKELRNLALKKLFFSGKFAARDGLDDYDDDFTYFEPLGDTVTSDMKFHARRKEKARLAELEEQKHLAENDVEKDESSADSLKHNLENEGLSEDVASEASASEDKAAEFELADHSNSSVDDAENLLTVDDEITADNSAQDEVDTTLKDSSDG